MNNLGQYESHQPSNKRDSDFVCHGMYAKNVHIREFLLWHSGLRIWHCLCSSSGHCWGKGSIPSLVQWVKGLELLQLWHSLQQQQLIFDPWPRNFHVLQCSKNKQTNKQKNKTISIYIGKRDSKNRTYMLSVFCTARNSWVYYKLKWEFWLP